MASLIPQARPPSLSRAPCTPTGPSPRSRTPRSWADSRARSSSTRCSTRPPRRRRAQPRSSSPRRVPSPPVTCFLSFLSSTRRSWGRGARTLRPERFTSPLFNPFSTDNLSLSIHESISKSESVLDLSIYESISPSESVLDLSLGSATRPPRRRRAQPRSQTRALELTPRPISAS